MLPLRSQVVTADQFSHLSLHYDVPSMTVDAIGLDNGKYTTLTIEGYQPGSEPGWPATPMHSSLIVIPFCTSINVSVESAVYDTIMLPDLPVAPLQPSRSKSDTGGYKFFLDEKRYAEDRYDHQPLLTVESLGIARDRNLARITFAPVQVNPVSKQAIVCRSADITLHYIGADSAATIEHYRRYNTQAFGSAPTINHLISAKDGNNASPLRMVIVAPSSLRCRRLDQFADWKRRQGMLVDFCYYNEQGLNSASSIATYLTSLYSNATDKAPAPTYVMLVGDNEQTPAFKSRLSNNSYYGISNSHITDLYYTTWTTGDNLPDCYIGRLSATDTVTLGRIINKTIFYESYAFEDDSYLGRATIISGVDSYSTTDNAYTYSDPTMDYAASKYLRPENGFHTLHYFKNNTRFSPTGVTVNGSTQNRTTDTILRELYNTGIGWINYSAHGEWNRWEIPLFNTTHVGQMTNNGRPSFMIGNCCLSNKFDRGECLGEALLRRADNAGAVAYIGATNSTYWSEDFYWSVGVRSNIYNTMNTAYDANHLGIYDRLFHTHNESFDQQAPTAGSIIYFGNMAVNSTLGNSWGNLVVPYYWEIYTLMGDPSLMPWLGTAQTITLNIDTTSRPIRISAIPGAYVAIIDSATLRVHCAAFAQSDGKAHLYLDDSVTVASTMISCIAQGYQPYIQDIENVRNKLTVDAKLYPNPSETRIVTVEGTNMQHITLYNPSGVVLNTYSPTSDTYTIDLRWLQPGIYMLGIDTDDGTITKRVVIK